jgi:PAS domain S-box-containing protein
MLKVIKIFSPPTFQDNEKTRNAKFFYSLLIGSALIITLLEIIELIVLPQNYLRWIFIIVIYNFGCLILLFLNRKGYYRLASFVFVVFLFIIIFVLAWSAGSLKSPAIQEIVIVILIAGLLLGWKEGLIIAFISILASLGLVFLENSGIIPINKVVPNSLSLWVNLTMSIGILALLQYLIVVNLRKAFLETKKETSLRKESESRIQSISNNLTEGMIYQLAIKPDGSRKFTYLSDSVRQLYGISVDEGLADSNLIYGRVHKDDIDTLINAENEAIKTLSIFRAELRIVETNGELRWSYLVSTPKLLDDGTICFDGIEFMITELKHTDAALKQSESLFRKMNENSPLGMHFYKLNKDKQLIFVGANPAADALLGVDNSQYIGKTIQEAFPPLSETEVPERYFEAAANGITWSIEQIQYQDNQISGAFEVTAFQTAPENMVAIFSDITERKKAEMDLKESEERFRLILENMPILLNAFDEKGNIIVWNKACEEATGYSGEEIINNPNAMELLYQDPEYREKVWNSSLDPNFKDNVYDLITKNKGIRTIEWFDIYHRISIPGWNSWGIGQDITNRVRAEEALKKSENYIVNYSIMPTSPYSKVQ